MSLQIEEKNLDKFIVVGDRVLIKPKNQQDRTKSGLYLPPGVHEKEKITSTCARTTTQGNCVLTGDNRTYFLEVQHHQ